MLAREERKNNNARQNSQVQFHASAAKGKKSRRKGRLRKIIRPLCLDTIAVPASLALHHLCDRVPTLSSWMLRPDDGAWLENRQGLGAQAVLRLGFSCALWLPGPERPAARAIAAEVRWGVTTLSTDDCAKTVAGMG